ncbi:hypothetical protein [Kineococcus rhizosphaerae]|uniref:Uncharacterized protein n=1 Tax=Kineococcus rhizosphaerae TaxID=559628 RepID=A0A2T0R066_9ACTN|nr:hypothetical protein [Kineococcus rhizosphaerae]PRY12532.1 hypothetical protein CLV37_11092 [Kineococcus rhizosphaerae]
MSQSDAQRIDELERTVTELVQQLQRDRPAVADGSPGGNARSSRRAVLAVPLALAAGAVASVATARPAAAAAGNPVLMGKENDSDGVATGLLGPLYVSGQVSVGDATFQDDEIRFPLPTGGSSLSRGTLSIRVPADEVPQLVYLTTHRADSWGTAPELSVRGGRGPFLQVTGEELGRWDVTGETAVSVASTEAPALVVRGNDGVRHEFGPVDRDVPTPGVGIDTAAGIGVGIRTASGGGQAMVATTTGKDSGADSVVVDNAGRGRAFLATSSNPVNDKGAVTGVNNGTGAGVWGHQPNVASTEAAVVGWSEGTAGRGGRFRGKAAQVRLMPGPNPTHPPSGLVGDLHVDSTGRLWFCKGATNWKQLA